MYYNLKMKIKNITYAIILQILFSLLADAKSFLVIGDSLSCGPFGKYLIQDLTKNGNKVTLYCTVSSAPVHWLKGKNPPGQKCQMLTSDNPFLQGCNERAKIPSLQNILALYKNADVIVALGTNSLLSPKVDKSYKVMAKAISENGSNCYWIGPPHLSPSDSKGFPLGRIKIQESNLNSFYDSLSIAIDKHCNLIDSRGATIAGTPGHQTYDGVHRTESAGKFWVAQISNNFKNSPMKKLEIKKTSK